MVDVADFNHYTEIDILVPQAFTARNDEPLLHTRDQVGRRRPSVGTEWKPAAKNTII